MKIKHLFLSFLFLSYSVIGICQKTIERPRLVIGIMIDGLQQKHIDLLWNYFDANGFKKIIEKGCNFNNVNYNIVSAGNASDIASIMTGSVPFYHGVAGNYFYNRSKDNVQSILLDNDEIGIGTKETFSAHHLLSSTINDELSLETAGKSKNFSVAIDPEAAILMGGHTAQSVCWIDETYLKWITTGYYKDGLSRWADEMNTNGTFNTLANQVWQPLYAINTYLSTPSDSKKNGFEFIGSTPKNKHSSSTIIKTTPAANSLVCELGSKIIYEEQMGMDNIPDMMMLQFTVRTPEEKFFALQTPQKEDIYLRLDKELQYLLQKVDSKIGLDRTLIFVFGNQTDIHSPAELGNNKIPAGYFNADRSMALLNTYLMAIYGQEAWVQGYYGKNIFLNKKKIEEKKINYREIQQTTADFMLEFAGIQSAFPSNQVLNMGGIPGTEMARLRNSVHKNSVGDVVITLLPGWLEVDEKLNPVGESNAIVSYTPVYFFGSKVKPQVISKSYQITDIAPTLARILNIPTPNACVGKTMEEVTE